MTDTPMTVARAVEIARERFPKSSSRELEWVLWALGFTCTDTEADVRRRVDRHVARIQKGEKR